jgi:hypothetical protein
MNWVLIMFLTVNNMPLSPVLIYFYSKDMCEAARTAILRDLVVQERVAVLSNGCYLMSAGGSR